MVRIIFITLLLSAFSHVCRAQAYYGEEAEKMIIKHCCQDFTIHIRSKSMKDSIPDMSFKMISLVNKFQNVYDTITINTVIPQCKSYSLYGYVKRKKNDIFFKSIYRGEYTLYLYIGKKEYVRTIAIWEKDNLYEATIDID